MKKKLLLFEGIASSGKTTLIKLLTETFVATHSLFVLPEEKTLIPFFSNKDRDIAIHHLSEMASNLPQSDITIIERFHLTHSFRTNTPLDYFKSIEEEFLQKYDVTVYLLTILEEHIRARIEETSRARGALWKHRKEGSLDERTEYYQVQQRYLLREAKNSCLQVIAIDTTKKEWLTYVQNIENEMSL